METAYDWLTVGIFTGLVVLFLQRSVASEEHNDKLRDYLIAGAGCAIVNYFGNEGQHAVAILFTAATLIFIVYFLKPFELHRKS